MEMEMLLIHLIASAGATIIVTGSTLFEPFRKLFLLSSEQRENSISEGSEKGTTKENITLFFKELFHCPLCLGFWMGAVMYFILGNTVSSFADIGILFGHACASSIVSILAYMKLK